MSDLSEKEKELLDVAIKNGLFDDLVKRAVSNNTNQIKQENHPLVSLVGSLTCIILLICLSICSIKFTINYLGI